MPRLYAITWLLAPFKNVCLKGGLLYQSWREKRLLKDIFERAHRLTAERDFLFIREHLRANPHFAEARNHRHYTLLHVAAYLSHNELIRVLIPLSDVKAQTSMGMTPLMFAAQAGNDEGCRLLLPHSDMFTETFAPIWSSPRVASSTYTALELATHRLRSSTVALLSDYLFSMEEKEALDAISRPGAPHCDANLDMMSQPSTDSSFISMENNDPSDSTPHRPSVKSTSHRL